MKDKTFLLDVDGVLVNDDQDHVWLNVLPKLYAKNKNMDLQESKKYWKSEYDRLEGQLVWSDVKFWSKKFGFNVVPYFDVPVSFPDAIEFLKDYGNQSIIVTANPYELIPIRAKNVAHLVKKVYSTFDFGLPKEDTGFFMALIKKEKLIPENCIFIDDRIKNVLSARKAGIEGIHIDRKGKAKKGTITSFKELE